MRPLRFLGACCLMPLIVANNCRVCLLERRIQWNERRAKRLLTRKMRLQDRGYELDEWLADLGW